MFELRSTKRRRQDDSDSDEERYLKKSRPFSVNYHHNGSLGWPSSSQLPVRPSVTPSPPRKVPDLELATQAQSDCSDTDSPASVHDDAIHFSSPRSRRSDVDHDMDMDVDIDETDFDIIGSPSAETPILESFHAPIRPAKLDSALFGHNSAVGNTGRIPTPLHPRFPAPRAAMHMNSMNGFGYPASGSAGGISMDLGNGYLGVPNSTALQAPPVLISSSHPDRSHRMPSPITEDDDFPDTPTALTQSQLSRLSVDEQMEMGDDSQLPPPGVNTTPTTGRKRSGALSGRGKFSMGYRDDCEKCRQRVPGHYSHFLP